MSAHYGFHLFSFVSTPVLTSRPLPVSADMFAHEDGGPEPEWVKTEREQFSDFRDLNKDGKMDLDEIRHWIMPQDYDHAQAEARHLVYESDQDKVQCFSCISVFFSHRCCGRELRLTQFLMCFSHILIYSM